MQALVTCVNYSDFLAITLASVLNHFSKVAVVTSPEDTETHDVCQQMRGRKLSMVITSEWHRDDLALNKGAAIDAGLRYLGPWGWICVLDADIYLPQRMDMSEIEPGHIYSPHRRILLTQGMIPPEKDWEALERGPEIFKGEYAGYFHLFHASDPKAQGPPWYRNDIWPGIQGCDTVFWRRWFPKGMRRLPFDVLHLGPPRLNWHGRITERWKVDD